MYDFSVDFNSIDKFNILNIHKYLMIKTNTKYCSALLNKCLFILLSFSESLAHVDNVSDQTKLLSLNNKPCTVRPTLIDLNPVELKYYPFMVCLDKCAGSCNVLSPKVFVPKEIKNINFKVFNLITTKNEATLMVKHISCNSKCKFNSTTCNSNKNGITKHVNMNVKIIVHAKKIIVEILAHVLLRIANT